MFCAQTLIEVPCTPSTAAASAVNGTQTLTSAGGSAGRMPFSSSMWARASATVLCIFQWPATYGRRPSGIVEHLHPGQRPAFEQLERGTAAGGHVGHAVGQAELRERGRGVAATDDRGPRRRGHGLGQSSGSV